jgi:hypothetical protein
MELSARILRPTDEVAAGSQAVLKRGPIQTEEVTGSDRGKQPGRIKQGFYDQKDGQAAKQNRSKDSITRKMV